MQNDNASQIFKVTALFQQILVQWNLQLTRSGLIWQVVFY